MGERHWTPLVYGRTRVRDDWWRAVPVGTSAPVDPWIADAVHAAVQGGRDLRHGPRFVLARHAGSVLVGVACRAVELSATMHTDGARELYCLVGWLGDGPAPALTEIRLRYREWAGAVYEQHVAPDWDRTDGGPRPSVAAPGPWPDREAPRSDLVPVPGSVQVWPEPDAAELWDAAGGAPSDVVVVTGLRTARPRQLHALTHASSLDATDRHLVTVPAAADAALPGPTRPEPDAAPRPRRSALRALVDRVRRDRTS